MGSQTAHPSKRLGVHKSKPKGAHATEHQERTMTADKGIFLTSPWIMSGERTVSKLKKPAEIRKRPRKNESDMQRTCYTRCKPNGKYDDNEMTVWVIDWPSIKEVY